LGFINPNVLLESTWFGQTDAHSWQEVQSLCKLNMLPAPGGAIGVVLSGGASLFFNCAKPPSPWLACRLTAQPSTARAEPFKSLRRSFPLYPKISSFCPEFFFNGKA
jgi:hypothetical protein